MKILDPIRETIYPKGTIFCNETLRRSMYIVKKFNFLHFAIFNALILSNTLCQDIEQQLRDARNYQNIGFTGTKRHAISMRRWESDNKQLAGYEWDSSIPDIQWKEVEALYDSVIANLKAKPLQIIEAKFGKADYYTFYTDPSDKDARHKAIRLYDEIIQNPATWPQDRAQALLFKSNALRTINADKDKIVAVLSLVTTIQGAKNHQIKEAQDLLSKL